MQATKSSVKARCGLSLVLLAALTGHSWGQSRTEVLLNADWKFSRENAAGAQAVSFNDSYWEMISLPHTWNARDGQDGGNDYYRGTGWYRKRLEINRRFRGRAVYLKFDGAATVAEVFVNGTSAGPHKGSFGAFCFDVTPLVKFGGTNIVAVRVNSAKDTTVAPLRGDFTIFGGLYRGVHLMILDKLSISPTDHASPGVYVKQLTVDREEARVAVTVKLQNGYGAEKLAKVRCSILDRSGRLVRACETTCSLGPGSRGDAVQTVTLSQPHLWNGRHDPYLYQVVVELFDGRRLADRVVQPFGLRFFRIDPNKGFFLNGQPYRLYGVNRHQDRQNKGWAISTSDHKEDFDLIREMGCTTVRLAHYQHAQEFYDLCDRGGMVVWAELALVDEIHPSVEFAVNCMDQLAELIKQNYNHPSIFFWSLYNELIPDGNRQLYEDLVAQLDSLAKELDATRLTVVASRSRYDGTERINAISDVVAYNVYRGWYEEKPEDFATYVDKMHERFPGQRFAISEYGAGAGIHQHEYPATRHNTRGPWHPEEWQSIVHEVIWKSMAHRPFLWGTFVWNMFDFASDGRSEGERLGMNDKGLVTHDRKTRKDAFYWYKANWNREPMVYIASRRFSPRPPGLTDVKVYSNCDSVQLYVNGRPYASKSTDDRILLWENIRLELGKNFIRATGTKNGKRFQDSCEWICSAEAGGRSIERK